MLGQVEFKRAAEREPVLRAGCNDVVRTQHLSEVMVLQNNTAVRLREVLEIFTSLFLAGMLEVALLSKKFSRLAQSLRLSQTHI